MTAAGRYFQASGGAGTLQTLKAHRVREISEEEYNAILKAAERRLGTGSKT